MTFNIVTYRRTKLLSFNPCFGGSYIVTVTTVTRLVTINKFQSLFWWILYCDHFTTSLTILFYFRFNPCFGGSYIVTITVEFARASTHKFQSLFWWILYCDGGNLPKKYKGSCVSILVLVDLIL